MIYLASPYTHVLPEMRRARYEIARQAAAALTSFGIATYSPVVYGHAIASIEGPFSGVLDGPAYYDDWLNHGFQMLEACSHFLTLGIEGALTSRGIEKERKRAIQLELPCHYIDMHEKTYIGFRLEVLAWLDRLQRNDT